MAARWEWSDDDLDEDEFPGEDEAEEFDDDQAELVECPRCGVDIYEDAEQCPLCGEWITHDTSAWSGRPWWWVVLGVCGIATLIAGLVLFVF
jgi:hypothetical protein